MYIIAVGYIQTECDRQGVYSGKSDCLDLAKGKTGKKRHESGQKSDETELAKTGLDSECLKTQ